MAHCSGVSIVNLELVNSSWKQSIWCLFFFIWFSHASSELAMGTVKQGVTYFLIDSGRRLGVDKTFRTSPRLLNIFCALNKRPISKGFEVNKTPKRLHWRHSGVFVFSFELISHLPLVFLFLTLCRLLFSGMVYITSIPVSTYFFFSLSDVINTSDVVLVSLFLTLNKVSTSF